jgi:hypothetical protein
MNSKLLFGSLSEITGIITKHTHIMNDNLLKYIAEQMAHLIYGEEATKYNEPIDEYEFIPEAQDWINREIENLRKVFKSYGCEANKKHTINFTMSDVQQMLDVVTDVDEGQEEVFVWALEDGSDLTINVGDDES